MAQPFKPKILIVDDEPDARQALAHSLRAKGYEVIEEGAGAPVLAKAKREWPALIILDVVLPDIPGTEVFQQLRADPVTKAIPVLLLTAKPEIVDGLPAFQGTSDRYFEKPGRIEDLLKTIHDMLIGTRPR